MTRVPRARLLPLTLLLSAVPALGACAAGATDVPPTATQAHDDDFPVKLTDDGGMTAAIQGVVTAVGSCPGLQVGQDRIVVVWPHGSTLVSRQPVTIRLPDGREVRQGMTLDGAGGFLSEWPAALPRPDCLRGDDEAFQLDEVERVEGAS